MPRRGNGEGSIYQRKGRSGWFGSVSVDGHRKIIRGATRPEVAGQIALLMVERDKGLLVVGRSARLEEFLDQWLTDVVKPRVREWTFKGYDVVVRVHITPNLGKVRLDKLTPGQVQNFLNGRLRVGLSPKSVRNIRQVLRTALNQAMRWGLVSRNVGDLVDGPKVERAEVHPMTPDEARQFLAAVRGDRLEALYAVVLALGLRQGEALGLRWSDLDLDAGILHVRHQLQRTAGALGLVPCKTDRSRRSLAVPASTLTVLKEHRERQLEEGRLMGDRWQKLDFMFTTPTGGPLEARTVIRWFKAILIKARLPERRFHDLRHSCATLLLVQGIPARVVMEILGHSDISMTMNTYTQVVPELGRTAADQMDALLTAQPKRNRGEKPSSGDQ